MSDISLELERLAIDNFEHKLFVPYPKVEALLDRETITNLLAEHDVPVYAKAEITNLILAGGRRLFAILIKIRDVGCISHFVKADQFLSSQLDSRLPLTEDSISRIVPNEFTCKQFFRYQWTFLSPVLRIGPMSRELHDRTVLPFLSSCPIQQGGFADVTKVEVDISHHKIPSTTPKVRHFLLVADPFWTNSLSW